MRYLQIIFIATLVALLGCATTLHKGLFFAPVPPPTDELTLVYFYRPHSPPFWRSPTLYVNNHEISDLNNVGYTYLYVVPGEYEIKTVWPSDTGIPDLKIKATFESGKTYYIRLGGDMRFSGLYVKTITSLAIVAQEEAKIDILNCMFIKQKIERLP